MQGGGDFESDSKSEFFIYKIDIKNNKFTFFLKNSKCTEIIRFLENWVFAHESSPQKWQ